MPVADLTAEFFPQCVERAFAAHSVLSKPGGEPLNPWEIGAVIWINERFSRNAEMMPSETVPVRPVGFPITITFCPSTAVVDLPSVRNGTSVARNFKTARSTPGGLSNHPFKQKHSSVIVDGCYRGRAFDDMLVCDDLSVW
jgi:hypothetical protein